MKISFLWNSVCACLVCFPLSVNAASYVYNYTGGNYNTITGSLFDSSMRLTGQVELAAPLDPGLELAVINPPSFTFNTGAFVLTQSSSLSSSIFKIATDASGNILDWSVELTESLPSPLSIGVTRNRLTTISFFDRAIVDEVFDSSPSGWLITISDEAWSPPAHGKWTVTAVPVIDIKPGKKSENVLNLGKEKNLKVAILGDETFDATQVNTTTVRFGVNGIEASPTNYKGMDYNRDGYGDLILTFKTSDTGIGCENTEAILTGETYPAPVIAIKSSDNFTVICK
jgi:hypothetical protein